MPRTLPPGIVELHRLAVPVRVDEALRKARADTGASMSWIRRRALIEYLVRQGEIAEAEVDSLMNLEQT